MGTAWICSQLVRRMSCLGTLNVQLASEMKAVLLGAGSLNLSSLTITPGSECQNYSAALQIGTKSILDGLNSVT